MPLEEKYADAKRTEWLEFIILSRLRKHEKFKRELEKTNRFNQSSWAIFSASIAIIIAIHPKEQFLQLLFTLIYFIVFYFLTYLLLAPVIEKIYSKIRQKVIGSSYTIDCDCYEIRDIIEEINNHTINQVYLANSLVTNIGRSTSNEFKLLQFYEIIDLLKEITIVIVQCIDRYELFQKNKNFNERRILTISQICDNIIAKIYEILSEDAFLNENLSNEINILDNRWVKIRKDIITIA